MMVISRKSVTNFIKLTNGKENIQKENCIAFFMVLLNDKENIQIENYTALFMVLHKGKYNDRKLLFFIGFCTMIMKIYRKILATCTMTLLIKQF